MRVLSMIYLLSVFCALFGVALLLPALVSLLAHEQGVIGIFLKPSLGLIVPSVGIYFCLHQKKHDLMIADSIAVVVLSWLLISVIAAIPFYLYHFGFVDAWFEATSGITTTGGEVFQGLDQWPKSVQFYHQWLQWLGGLGIIVLALALLPILGLGNVPLYRTQLADTVKEYHMALRMQQIAHALWFIYLSLTLLCVLVYWWVGLPFFDALCAALSTVSTGGFMIHDTGFMYYHNVYLESAAAFFMFLGGIKFVLHYGLLTQFDFKGYLKDAELVRWMHLIIIALVFVITLLMLHWIYTGFYENLRYGAFMVLSMITTTGFANSNYATWPNNLPFALLFLAFFGGCVGSTTGGFKIMRWILLRADALRSLRQILHPKAVFKLHFDGHVVDDAMVHSVRGYLTWFFVLFVFFSFCLLFTGMAFQEAIAAIISNMTNLGASIGGLAKGYMHLLPLQKIILIAAMLTGRLEIMLVLVCFLPSFWRKF